MINSNCFCQLNNENLGKFTGQIDINPPVIIRLETIVPLRLNLGVFQFLLAFAIRPLENNMICMLTRLDALNELAPGRNLLTIGQRLMLLIDKLNISNMPIENIHSSEIVFSALFFALIVVIIDAAINTRKPQPGNNSCSTPWIHSAGIAGEAIRLKLDE